MGWGMQEQAKIQFKAWHDYRGYKARIYFLSHAPDDFLETPFCEDLSCLLANTMMLVTNRCGKISMDAQARYRRGWRVRLADWLWFFVSGERFKTKRKGPR